MIPIIHAETTNINLTPPVEATSFGEVIKNFTGKLLIVAIPVCVVAVLIGGIQIITSGGNPEGVSRGKKTILWAAIGLVAILAAGSVVTIINQLLGP